MASKFQWVEIGKQKVKLSNLEKELYPGSGIIKAEVIQYYLKIAPTLLRHIKYRPLSLIRFPDGVGSTSFFQKDRPDWAPDWIESVTLGRSHAKDYMFLTNEASVVWLANLACLELHIMQISKSTLESPDYFVIDLDPSPRAQFQEVKELAWICKEYVEQLGYHPFLKTSGGKGLHLFIPVLTNWTHDQVFEAVSDIGKGIIKKYPHLSTLKLKKESREQKILVDIYRNRRSQTIVAPYSLRGKPGAPVSMPISWEWLENLDSNLDYHLNNVIESVIEEGDQWEGFASFAGDLHTQKRVHALIAELPPNPRHKTPEQLEAYGQKRDFEKTPEPTPEIALGEGNAFVIHRHHATRIHYDLRLEQKGVLVSWAVPKGMPPFPGIKRLAVQTEPHPMKYLHFDGEIPKGEYGAGMMWKYAVGKYSITKEKKDGFYFKLSSPNYSGEYRMHNTKGKEWLLERVDHPQILFSSFAWEVMLADPARKLPKGSKYTYEIKWDGIRVLIIIDEGETRILSRGKKDLTAQFPEIADSRDFIKASNAVIDAEIVCLDQAGAPVFKKVIGRMHQKSEVKIQRLTKSNPAYAYVFDILYLDGKSTTKDPLFRRREWLEDIVKKGSNYRFSQTFTDGKALYQAAKEAQLEGIIAKDPYSRYFPGKRTQDWLKIKFRNSIECVIIGYTAGQGERAPYFGALHIMEKSANDFIYRGKVGTGFDMVYMKYLKELMDGVPQTGKPIDFPIPDERVSIWIQPELVAEIEYAAITDQGTLREPVFKGLVQDV